MKKIKVNNYKSDLMRLAHKYRKRWCISLSDALKCAWALYNVVGSSLFINDNITINILIGNHNSNVCFGNNNVLNSGYIVGSVNNDMQ